MDKASQANYLPNGLEWRLCAMQVGRPREFDKDRALDRATELFWRKGYEGTSLSDLTDELGITRPSLYAAFGNKEMLFRLALDRYEAKSGAYRTRALTAPTAYAMARQLLEGAADLHGDKNNPVGCLGVHGALACSDGAGAIRQELSSRRREGEKAIRQRLERAKAEGDLPAESNPADLARYLSVVIYGMTVQAVGGATRAELHGVAEVALKQWPNHQRGKSTSRKKPKSH
jgi:AcrR family transcriptional regulator